MATDTMKLSLGLGEAVVGFCRESADAVIAGLHTQPEYDF